MDSRGAEIDAFLSAEGWSAAARSPIAGDASSRRYVRLARDGARAVLMDAPPETCGSQEAFVGMAAHLRQAGLAAPGILAADEIAGLFLLQDLGAETVARVVERDRQVEVVAYEAATDALVRLQAAPLPDGLPRYGAREMAAAIRPAWSDYAGTGEEPSAEWLSLEARLGEMLAERDMEAVTIHRDYHAENLIWRGERAGLDRLGILDFQDAMAGHPAYDLASLLQDARRDVAPALRTRMIARFADARGMDEAELGAAVALQGVQRHLRILGIFARLARVRGKPGYLRLLPRVWSDLHADLDHPAAAPLAPLVDAVLPAPRLAA